LLKDLSSRTGLNIVTNTGWYRPPLIPPLAYELTEDQIADLWAGEYINGIGDTGVRPGFIKIALNGPVPRPEPVSVKILRAAIQTSKRTGMPIVSHTVWSEGALLAADIMDEEGLDAERMPIPTTVRSIRLPWHARACG
jgi:phosphotriesterase-related protein